MSEICTIGLEYAIQNCINALTTSSSACSFVFNATEVSNNDINAISSFVSNINDLPDLNSTEISPGTVIFVNEIGVPVVSTGCEWAGIDGRILRRDWITRSLYLWGVNNGSLGLGTGSGYQTCPVREITSELKWLNHTVSCTHSAAIKSDRSLWLWGENTRGQLGNQTVTSTCSPVREFTSSTTWCQVSLGRCHSHAIKTDYTLWSWGNGFCGRLGIGGIDPCCCTPTREICSATNWCQVSAGYRSSSAIKTDGSLYSWGCNNSGDLGNGITTNSSSPVREISSDTLWCQVSTGCKYTIALKTDGSLWGWGDGNNGQLGNNTLTLSCSPVREITSGTTWCRVSSGNNHTLAIKTDNSLWTWGANANYQLGDTTNTTRSSPVREICSSTNWCAVAAGRYNSLALKTDGSLWGWGNGACGVLASATTSTFCSPVRELNNSTSWSAISVQGCVAAGMKTL